MEQLNAIWWHGTVECHLMLWNSWMLFDVMEQLNAIWWHGTVECHLMLWNSWMLFDVMEQLNAVWCHGTVECCLMSWNSWMLFDVMELLNAVWCHGTVECCLMSWNSWMLFDVVEQLNAVWCCGTVECCLMLWNSWMLFDVVEQLEQLRQLSEMVITSPVALSHGLGSIVGLWGGGVGGWRRFPLGKLNVPALAIIGRVGDTLLIFFHFTPVFEFKFIQCIFAGFCCYFTMVTFVGLIWFPSVVETLVSVTLLFLLTHMKRQDKGAKMCNDQCCIILAWYNFIFSTVFSWTLSWENMINIRTFAWL